ncbi:MAG: glutathione S-transferase [Rhodobacteraceae bacterium]|nr:glutathione S-transferase [Paracoccaceae bacterium]
MSYTLAIADRIYSSWSLRGWLMFQKFDIPVTIKTARMYQPEFVDMLADFGGGKTVPAMRIDGARPIIISDTLAIAETLNERHPEINMWPTDPVARGIARSIVAEIHAGFSALRTDCTMNLLHIYKDFQPSPAVLADVARIEEIWTDARNRFGADGPWLFGKYSLADVFYTPVVTRMVTYALPLGATSTAYANTAMADADFNTWRNDGLAENYVQPGYNLDIPASPWPDFDKN